mgnify:CR=1 FL=1
MCQSVRALNIRYLGSDAGLGRMKRKLRRARVPGLHPQCSRLKAVLYCTMTWYFPAICKKRLLRQLRSLDSPCSGAGGARKSLGTRACCQSDWGGPGTGVPVTGTRSHYRDPVPVQTPFGARKFPVSGAERGLFL